MNLRHGFQQAAKNVLKGITVFMPTFAFHAVTQRAVDAFDLGNVGHIPLEDEWGGPEA